MSAAKTVLAPGEWSGEETGNLRLFAQLLHALNQPVTGLQCSLELALAGPRTERRYVDCIEGGLELTERMRHLVMAIRELVDVEEAKTETLAMIEVAELLRE